MDQSRGIDPIDRLAHSVRPGNGCLELTGTCALSGRDLAFRFHLQDFLAVVVGYGMAALLCRAFWPASRPSPVLGVPGIGVYLWLGLAMSGPIIMLRRASAPATGPVGNGPHQAHRRLIQHTWAELAWMLIGIYWIVLSLFVIPARLSEFKLGDMILFGLVPLAVALGLRLLGPRPKEYLDVGACMDPRRGRRTSGDLAHRLDLFDRLGKSLP